MNKIPCSSVTPHFFPHFSLPLGIPIESEIMDEFWHSRCLNDRIDLLYIFLFLFFPHLLGISIESEMMEGFWHSRCLNDRINLPNMIGSLANGANTSLVAKNGTKINHGNCSTAIVSQYIWKLLILHGFIDPGQLLCTKFLFQQLL